MMITSTVSPALKIGLQLLGLWPDIPYSFVYWLSFTSSILIIQCFQYSYIIDHFNMSELSNLVDSLSVSATYSLTFFKLCSLWIHRRILHQILTDMDNDWCECININPHLHRMTIKANLAHFISNRALSFTAITAAFYFLGEYAIRFVFLTEDYNNTLRQLPMKIQLPFETQQSPMFEFLVVTTYLHILLQACTAVIINGLIITLVLHASGQIDILCQEFKDFSRHTIFNKTSLFSFGMLIERHNRIISFSENIEELFSFIILMQVFWVTLLNSCLGFIIIIAIHNETGVFILVKTVFGYSFVMIEAFIICFVGEYLSHKSTLIANATYETAWYNMPSNVGKTIMFIIMRSQNRLTITAGKMTEMSFETFTNIIKASASYISVLNAIY